MDIQELLQGQENKILEFKEDLSSPAGILRTITAFSNTAGGILILGVEDKTKKICGIEEPLLQEEKLANLISDSIAPKIVPNIEIVLYRNTHLITVEIYPSPIRPHYLKKEGELNGTYIRVGSTNRRADKVIISELKRVVIDGAFDEQAFPDLSAKDIDFKAASEQFRPVCNLKKSNLETLGILTKYQGHKVPTIAGVILFCQQREKYFPDAWIQAGRFAGKTKTDIVDTREIRSLPVLAIDEAMFFVKKHAMHGIKIPEGSDGNFSVSSSESGPKHYSVSSSKSGPKHYSVSGGESLSRHLMTWNWPLVAIREAIINAVVHADYEQKGSPIRVAIFDNRIEIENPGLLPFGLVIEDIKKGVSKLRNRVIGRIFHKLGLIEQWGSGIGRIIKTCEEAGFGEPVFEEIGTHFRVTIFTEQKTKPLTDETDQKILKLLENLDGSSTETMAHAINLSKKATRTRMLNLIAKGLVVEIGMSPKDPHKKYFLVKK